MLNKQLSRKLAVITLSAMSLSSVAAGARAAFIQNGDFNTYTGTAPGELGYNVDATGWTYTGFNLLYTPGSADTTGAPNHFGDSTKLWGPANGSANGLTTSPVGGNFAALDADSQVPGAVGPGPSSISQVLSGLTPGQDYTVSFYYAGAQQDGADPVSGVPYDEATSTSLQVNWGMTFRSTPILNNEGKGFTGWKQASFTFTAARADETLKFLATGGPIGQPPMALLDGVTVTPASVPEAPVYIGAVAALGLGAVLRAKLTKKN